MKQRDRWTRFPAVSATAQSPAANNAAPAHRPRSVYLRFAALTAALAALIGGIGLFPALPSSAADGDLDTTFNTTGKVITTVNADGAAVLLQPDGKLVVAGSRTLDNLIAHYNSSGSPDTSFGNNGKAALSQGTAAAIIRQSTGKLVVAGRDNQLPWMARFNENGSLDNSFGGGSNGVFTADLIDDLTFGEPDAGFVVTSMSTGQDDRIESIAVQADNKIVAVGSANAGQFAMARYTADGVLDTTFGVGGKVTRRPRSPRRSA